MSDHGIKELSEEQYRMASGVAQSDLKLLVPPSTPAHYKYYKEKEKCPPTPAQRLGLFVHAKTLQPDLFKSQVVTKPEGTDLRTVDGKKWRQDQAGKEIMALEEAMAVKGMSESLLAHPIARRFIENSRKEVCVFAEDSDGILRKGRIDLLPTSGNSIADIKTTSDASLAEFNKQVFKLGHALQAAYYTDLLTMIGDERDSMVFLAVESFPPYCVACYPIDPISMEIGQSMYRAALKVWKACTEADLWPGYPTTLDNVCGLPEWVMKGFNQ